MDKENIDYEIRIIKDAFDEKRNIIKSIKEGKKISCVGCTAGHFYRGV